ncbi:DUF192 domain-containing protein [Marinibaculum pumilum]|uniref:DUF192 domain-containing protein n=1 Tax=Marinibaculum pumilum TaxID=1766165 RepID=A0ABV7KUP0_9PROT
MPDAKPQFAGPVQIHAVRALAFLLLAGLWLAQAGPAAALERSELVVQAETGAQRFVVEVAATPQEQAQGLMHRRSLDADAGMLFPFPEARPARFWMRNTFVSLDLLFIAPDGRIESIHARAQPLDESTIPSRGAVIAVLEILAGEAERRGIRPGDRVLHPALPAPDTAPGGSATGARQ